MFPLLQVGDQVRVPAAHGGGDALDGVARGVLQVLLHDRRRAETQGRRSVSVEHKLPNCDQFCLNCVLLILIPCFL